MTTDTGIAEAVKEDIKISEPKLYNVLLHNDDTTTMEFVISVLVSIFHRNVDDAIKIMTSVHNEGVGVAGGPYTKEIAEEKVFETTQYAQLNGFSLQSSFEEN